MDKKMQDALNEQINAELYSAYLYQAMSAYFESINLKGAATWMTVQAQEEVSHAMRIYNYVFERGGRVILKGIKAPDESWESPLQVFEQAYEHETHVTSLINKLVDLAAKLSDHATNNMLQWFVAEQVEEEASADEVVQKLKLVGSDGGGLFMVDQELGQRTFTPASAESEG
jgi:ferritin